MNTFLEGFQTVFLFICGLCKDLAFAFYNTFTPSFYRMKDVSTETVLITGAGSGIGRLVAKRFAALGCRLVLWDIDAAGLETTASECRENGGTFVANFVVDLAKREAIYAMAERVKADVGDIDILINNAGIVTGKPYLESPDPLIEKTMLVNINAHFWMVKSFLPSMMDRNHGHIVTIASAAGIIGVNGLADYCASKFAAVGFDEALRYELLAKGCEEVYTTVVCPYYINTGMFEGVKTTYPILLPILEPDYVADKIVTAIRTNQKMLYLPRILYFILSFKGILPVSMVYRACTFFGVSNSMDDFKGRNNSNKKD